MHTSGYISRSEILFFKLLMDPNRKKIYLELHVPVRSVFPRRKIDIRGWNETWQSDLIDLKKYASQNKKYKFILVVIDNFSKYVWLEALRTKSGPEVTKAFKKITKRAPKPPFKLQTISQFEYKNVHLKKFKKNIV